MNVGVKIVRVFIEKWLDEDHGEHADWAIVEDMKLVLHGLNESIRFDKEDNLLSEQPVKEAECCDESECLRETIIALGQEIAEYKTTCMQHEETIRVLQERFRQEMGSKTK